MVHGFARQLGGALMLESAPGEGTTAHIWLPAAAPLAPAPATQEAEMEAEPDRPLTVLLVDDDALILMNTAALLEDLGHRVIEANSGAEALDLFRANPGIDLLITDQAMPAMTGSELIATVRGARPDLPIVLATGYGEMPDEMSGAVHRLGKPFNQNDLRRAVLAAAG